MIYLKKIIRLLPWMLIAVYMFDINTYVTVRDFMDLALSNMTAFVIAFIFIMAGLSVWLITGIKKDIDKILK